MQYKAISITLLLVLLSGCNEDKQKAEITRTVDWYNEHKVEREAKIEECNNNPGELEITPNCFNAKKSVSMAVFKGRGHIKLTPLTAEDLKKGR